MPPPKDIPKHLCTQRSFAEELGVSHQHVSQAIKQGKIGKSAMEEFKGKSYLNRELAKQHWRANWSGLGNASAKLAVALQSGNDEAMGEDDAIRHKNLVTKARDADTIYKSQMSKLKYEQAAGVLVNKADVSRALFEFGREIRNKLTAIPARVVDYVRSAATRHEAEKLIAEAIHTVLEDISNIENRLKNKTNG